MNGNPKESLMKVVICVLTEKLDSLYMQNEREGDILIGKGGRSWQDIGSRLCMVGRKAKKIGNCLGQSM